MLSTKRTKQIKQSQETKKQVGVVTRYQKYTATAQITTFPPPDTHFYHPDTRFFTSDIQPPNENDRAYRVTLGTKGTSQ